MTLIVVAYDVNTETREGRRRLRRVARICQNFGQRVQNSVFECWVDPVQWTRLKADLIREYDPKLDSLRFYFLGDNWRGRVEQYGSKVPYDPEAPLIL